MSTGSPPIVVSERYQISTHLGDSRSAAVFCAHDTRLDRDVLLHVTHAAAPQGVPGMGGRSRILLPVFDNGTLEGRSFTVTEHVTGQVLAEAAPLPPHRVLAMLRSLVEGLADPHTQSQAYPPITSRSVWLMEHERVVLVDDWQLAAPQRAQLEAAYRAPELGQASLPTPTATVYALGVLVREALRGSSTPHGNRLPASLATVVARATLPDPQQRYATPSALLQAFEAAVNGSIAPTQGVPVDQRPTQPYATPPAQPRLHWAGGLRLTKAMPNPPPPFSPGIAAPAHQPTLQPMAGWQMPRWRLHGWQGQVLRRSLWLVQRVILIGLILVGLRFAYTALDGNARGLEAQAWLDRNRPSWPTFPNIGAWIDQQLPDPPDIGAWIDQTLPDIEIPQVALPDVDIGAWIGEQTGTIQERVSTEIGSVQAPTVYQATQPVNLRSEPSTDREDSIIARLAAGTRIQQQGQPQVDADGAAYSWVRVVVLDNTQQQGWVALSETRLQREP